MADLGRRIKTWTAPEPLPVPQFAPRRVETPVPAETERELVPVRRKEEN